jgi:hypothetical protein
MGNGPTWRARNEAEPCLQGEVVNLVDYAVDVVAEVGADLTDGAVLSKELFDSDAALHEWVDGEPPFAEDLHHVELGVGWHGADLAPAIGEEMQRPCRCYFWVELA